jgi:hypothetical protein
LPASHNRTFLKRKSALLSMALSYHASNGLIFYFRLSLQLSAMRRYPRCGGDWHRPSTC